MIKGPQITEILREGFHYITAITKPQIESLLKSGVFQMELFDPSLAEVCEPETRYVLRRNPVRAAEMQANRQSKLDALAMRADLANQNLTEHPRAKVATAVKSLQKQIVKLKLASWVSVGQVEGRRSWSASRAPATGRPTGSKLAPPRAAENSKRTTGESSPSRASWFTPSKRTSAPYSPPEP